MLNNIGLSSASPEDVTHQDETAVTPPLSSAAPQQSISRTSSISIVRSQVVEAVPGHIAKKTAGKLRTHGIGQRMQV